MAMPAAGSPHALPGKSMRRARTGHEIGAFNGRRAWL
jgi:hypothetical protein